jgi:hypothetical protein
VKNGWKAFAQKLRGFIRGEEGMQTIEAIILVIVGVVAAGLLVNMITENVSAKLSEAEDVIDGITFGGGER